MNAPDPRTRATTSAWRRRWRSWLGWSTREKVELLELVALACVAEVAVRVAPLPAIAGRCGIAVGSEAETLPTIRRRSLDDAEVDRRAAAVDRLYRVWPRRDSCLRRALVLGFRIREASPTLRIGVEKEGDAIRAHAWIEAGGRVVGDETGDYAPLRGAQGPGR